MRMLLSLALVYSVIGPDRAYGKVINGGSSAGLIELLKVHSLNLKTNNISGLSSSFSQIASFYERSGAWKEARYNYVKALSFQTERDQRVAAANSSIHLAYVLSRENQYSSALGHATNAATRYKELGLKDSTASSIVFLSELNRKLGRYQTAESLVLKRALPLYRSAGDLNGRTRCFRSLGHTYWQQRRFSEAKWFFIQENMQARKLRDKDGIVSSLLYLGKVKIDIGDYSLAIKDFKEAEQLARDKGERKVLSQVQEAFALVYRKQGLLASSAHYETLAAANKSESYRLKRGKAEEAVRQFSSAQRQVTLKERLAMKPVKIAPARKALYVINPVTYVISLSCMLLFISTVLLIWKRRIAAYSDR